MASIVSFHKAVLGRFERQRQRKQAAEQAVVNGRAVLQTLGILLDSQRISPVTTKINFLRGGKMASISLLEIIRGAEVAFNELEQVNNG